jgi:hypothetical protein
VIRKAWRLLEKQVLTPLVTAKSGNDHLRIWIPGCGSGEEAYSMAMLILELQSRHDINCPIQIFASDIDEAALETALAHEILLREYAPASAIVNRKGEAIYYQGPVSRFLEIVPGKPRPST